MVDAVRSENDGILLHDRKYLGLLLIAALIGIPVSVVAFAFLAVVHELEHVVWETLPADLGFSAVPGWWPIVTLGLAGLLVGLVAVRLPGHGGHVPVDGMGGGPTAPIELPGIMIAASASLVLGAVVGPEAPLMAIGGGLAALAMRNLQAAGNTTAIAVVAASGSAAAVSAIFGNPLVAAIIVLEMVGLAGRQLMLFVVPCLVSSGTGALVFTGLGDWTGLEIGALTIPGLRPSELGVPDLLAALPIAAVVAAGTWAVFVVGTRTAGLATSRTVPITVAAGLIAGCSAAAYALVTTHSPAEAALSGQATLAALAAHPGDWSAGALIALVVCKGIAYGLCIGVFRGGPVFPAIFLGAAVGVLSSTLVPSIGIVPGLAIGMAAGAVAATRFPVTGIVLVVLLLGDAATEVMPVIILAGVGALVVEELLRTVRSHPQRMMPEQQRREILEGPSTP